MKDYEAAIEQIPFYRERPFLKPFVGKHYESAAHRKLLIVGESHYAPEGETLHRNVEGWYDGSTQVTEDMPLYWNCLTRRTFADFKAGRFSKVILGELGALCGAENPAEEVAFCNYFLRPADNRKSFREISTELDRKMSVENFAHVLAALSPDVVCFASKEAIVSAEKYFPKLFGKEIWDRGNGYVFWVYHPSFGNWDRHTDDPNFNGLTSREFFREQLSENWLLVTSNSNFLNQSNF